MPVRNDETQRVRQPQAGGGGHRIGSPARGQKGRQSARRSRQEQEHQREAEQSKTGQAERQEPRHQVRLPRFVAGQGIDVSRVFQ
jgi:hypothetical protein